MSAAKTKDKQITKCFACGEDVLSTGNYTAKVLPSKRIPRKVYKIVKKKREAKHLSIEYNVPNRFKKYFVGGLIQPNSNTLEISCGICKSVSKIKMKKTDRGTSSSTGTGTSANTPKNSSTNNPTPLSKSQKKKLRKSKTPKEVNAGLFIPPSLLASSKVEVETTKPVSKTNTSLSNSKEKKQSKPHTSTTSFKAVKFSSTVKSDVVKKNQLNSLRRTLFMSQQNQMTSTKSLQDFLNNKWRRLR